MLGDLLGDLHGNLEGERGLGAADAGRVAGAGALGESGELELERLVLLDLDRLLDDAGIDLAVDFAALVEVVEREVGVVLEDADLAHFLEADAAGGDVGHAAVFKADAGVGDVLALAQDGGADRVDRLDGRADEMEHDL